MTQKTDKNILGWEVTNWQYNNILPIIVSVLMMAMSYGTLLTRVSVIETKLDLILKKQDEYLAKNRDIEIRYGELSLQVKKNETQLENLNRIINR